MNIHPNFIFITLMIFGSLLAGKKGQTNNDQSESQSQKTGLEGLDPFKSMIQLKPKKTVPSQNSLAMESQRQELENQTTRTKGFGNDKVVNIYNLDRKPETGLTSSQKSSGQEQVLQKNLADKRYMPSNDFVLPKNQLKSLINLKGKTGASNQDFQPRTSKIQIEQEQPFKSEITFSSQVDRREPIKPIHNPMTIQNKNQAFVDNINPFESFIIPQKKSQPLFNKKTNPLVYPKENNKQPLTKNPFTDVTYKKPSFQSQTPGQNYLEIPKVDIYKNNNPFDNINELNNVSDQYKPKVFQSSNRPKTDSALIQRVILLLETIGESKAMNSPSTGANIKSAFDSFSKNTRLFLKALDGNEDFPNVAESFLLSLQAHLNSLSLTKITDHISTSYKIKYDVIKLNSLLVALGDIDSNINKECSKWGIVYLKSQACPGLAKSVLELMDSFKNIKKISTYDDSIDGYKNKTYMVYDENLDSLTLEYLRSRVARKLETILSGNHVLTTHMGLSKFHSPAIALLNSLKSLVNKSNSRAFMELIDKFLQDFEFNIASFNPYSVKGNSVSKYLRITEANSISFVNLIQNVIAGIDSLNLYSSQTPSDPYYVIKAGLQNWIKVLENAFNCKSGSFFYELVEGEDICQQLIYANENQQPGSINAKRATKIINYVLQAIQKLKNSEKFNNSTWIASLVNLLSFNNELIRKNPDQLDHFDFTIDFVKNSIHLANVMTYHLEEFDSDTVTYNTYDINAVDTFRTNLDLIETKLISFAEKVGGPDTDVNIQLFANELSNLKHWAKTLVQENGRYYEINDKHNVEFVLPQYALNKKGDSLVKTFPKRNSSYIHNNSATLTALIDLLTPKTKHVQITNLYKVTIPTFKIFMNFYRNGAYSKKDVKQFEDITESLSDVVKTMKSTITTIHDGPETHEIRHNDFDPVKVNDLIGKIQELKKYGSKAWKSGPVANPEADSLIDSLGDVEKFLTNLFVENGQLVEYPNVEEKELMDRSKEQLSQLSKKTIDNNGRQGDMLFKKPVNNMRTKKFEKGGMSEFSLPSDSDISNRDFKVSKKITDLDKSLTSEKSFPQVLNNITQRNKPELNQNKSPSVDLSQTSSKISTNLIKTQIEPEKTTPMTISKDQPIRIDLTKSLENQDDLQESDQEFYTPKSNKEDLEESLRLDQQLKKFDFSHLSLSNNENPLLKSDIYYPEDSFAQFQKIIHQNNINQPGSKPKKNVLDESIELGSNFEKGRRGAVVLFQDDKDLIDENKSGRDSENLINERLFKPFLSNESSQSIANYKLSDLRTSDFLKKSSGLNKKIITPSPALEIEKKIFAPKETQLNFERPDLYPELSVNLSDDRLYSLSKSNKNSPEQNSQNNDSINLLEDQKRTLNPSQLTYDNLSKSLESNQTKTPSKKSNYAPLKPINQTKGGLFKNKDNFGDDDYEDSFLISRDNSLEQSIDSLNKSDNNRSQTRNDEKLIQGKSPYNSLKNIQGKFDLDKFNSQLKFKNSKLDQPLETSLDDSHLFELSKDSVSKESSNSPKIQNPLLINQHRSNDLIDSNDSALFSRASKLEAKNNLKKLKEPFRIFDKQNSKENKHGKDDTLNWSFESRRPFDESLIIDKLSDNIKLSPKSGKQSPYSTSQDIGNLPMILSQGQNQPSLKKSIKSDSQISDKSLQENSPSQKSFKKSEHSLLSESNSQDLDEFNNSNSRNIKINTPSPSQRSQYRQDSQFDEDESFENQSDQNTSRPNTPKSMITVFGNRIDFKMDRNSKMDSETYPSYLNDSMDDFDEKLLKSKVKEVEKRRIRKRVIVFVEHINCRLCLNDGQLANFVRTVLKIYK